MTPCVIAGCEVSQSTALCDIVLSLQPFVALDPGHFSSFRWRFGRGCATSQRLRVSWRPTSMPRYQTTNGCFTSNYMVKSFWAECLNLHHDFDFTSFMQLDHLYTICKLLDQKIHDIVYKWFNTHDTNLEWFIPKQSNLQFQYISILRRKHPPLRGAPVFRLQV